MITAVDTSVLLDIYTADPKYLVASQKALRKTMQQGSLIVCEVVVAELRPCFLKNEILLNSLETLGIDYSFIPQNAALLAGEIWKKYRQAGGKREHLIPDFLIAAHASVCADRLLTRDRGFYRRWFTELNILQP